MRSRWAVRVWSWVSLRGSAGDLVGATASARLSRQGASTTAVDSPVDGSGSPRGFKLLSPSVKPSNSSTWRLNGGSPVDQVGPQLLGRWRLNGHSLNRRGVRRHRPLRLRTAVRGADMAGASMGAGGWGAGGRARRRRGGSGGRPPPTRRRGGPLGGASRGARRAARRPGRGGGGPLRRRGR